jgi:hypothetical protein
MGYNLLQTEHNEIERFAYELWEERGRPLGSPDVDWFRAEATLLRHFGVPAELHFSSILTEPLEE